MFRKILCAVDLEEGTEAVVRCACDVASRYPDAQLILAYVAEIPLLTLAGGKGDLQLPEEDVAAVDRAAVKLRKMAKDRLEDLIQMMGVHAKVLVVEGPPVASAVIDIIEQENADLLVLGSHRKGPIRRLLLGSISDKLAHRAPCPVLIIKPPRGTSESTRGRRMPETGGGL